MTYKCKNDHIYFSKRRQSYIVYISGKSYSYSINRYGNFAKKLAELTLHDKRKYYDYFKHNEDNTTTFFINTHKYGVKEVIVDSEDAKIFFDMKISVYKDNHAYTFYASTKLGRVHRLIMNPNTSKDVVDHINRNGLDNRKENLRIVDISVNNKNCNIRSDNKTGYKGILENEHDFRLYYYDNNKKKHSKSFSKNKYGTEKALELILDFRSKVYKKYNYVA